MEKYQVGDAQPRATFGIDPEMGEIELRTLVMLVRESGKIVVFNVGTGGSVCCGAVFGGKEIFFGCCDHSFYALSKRDGEELWRFGTNDVINSTANFWNNKVFFGSHDGNMYGLDMEGRQVFRYPTNSPISYQPEIVNDMIIFGSKDGVLRAVSLKDKKEVWRFHTNGPLCGGGKSDGKTFFTGSMDNNFYALSLKDGSEVWRFATGDAIGSKPAIHKGIVYFGSSDKNVYALDTQTGALIFKYPTTGLTRSIAIYDDMVFAPSRDMCLHAISLDGKPLWKFRMDDYMVREPAFHNSVLYLASTDFNLYAVEAKTGKELWRFSTGGPLVGPAVCDGSFIYFGSWDCNFYCIDLQGNLQWKFHTSLSHPASIEIPETSQARTVQAVWQPAIVEKKKEKYKTGETGDYSGEFKSDYTSGLSMDYLGFEKEEKTPGKKKKQHYR